VHLPQGLSLWAPLFFRFSRFDFLWGRSQAVCCYIFGPLRPFSLSCLLYGLPFFAEDAYPLSLFNPFLSVFLLRPFPRILPFFILRFFFFFLQLAVLPLYLFPFSFGPRSKRVKSPVPLFPFSPPVISLPQTTFLSRVVPLPIFGPIPLFDSFFRLRPLVLFPLDRPPSLRTSLSGDPQSTLSHAMCFF